MEGIEARLLATDDSDLGLEIMEIKMKGRGVVVSGTVSLLHIVAGSLQTIFLFQYEINVAMNVTVLRSGEQKVRERRLCPGVLRGAD